MLFGLHVSDKCALAPFAVDPMHKEENQEDVNRVLRSPPSDRAADNVPSASWMPMELEQETDL